MPQIEENLENQKSKFTRRPTTLDREQLEYIFPKILTCSVLIFAAVGTCASVAHMTFQQLKK